MMENISNLPGIFKTRAWQWLEGEITKSNEKYPNMGLETAKDSREKAQLRASIEYQSAEVR